MNIVTTYFSVALLPGAMQLGAALGGVDGLRKKYEGQHEEIEKAAILNTLKAERQEEYEVCIRRNASLCSPPSSESVKYSSTSTAAVVEGVHLLVQDAKSWSTLRSRVLPTVMDQHPSAIVASLHTDAPAQPLYSDLFTYCNKYLQGQLCMVCNADIHLPVPTSSTSYNFPIDALKKELLRTPSTSGGDQVVVALSRYEDESLSFAPLIDDYRGSHDAFIFRSPLKQSFVDAVNHKQNCYQAENLVIYELQRSGYRVVNPCRDLKIAHQHRGELRQWFPSADESRYGKAAPCSWSEAFPQPSGK